MTPLCKSTLRRPRASRPLASRFEEEAVRDDVRVFIRTSVLHQVQSCRLGRGEDGWRLLPLHPLELPLLLFVIPNPSVVGEVKSTSTRLLARLRSRRGPGNVVRAHVRPPLPLASGGRRVIDRPRRRLHGGGFPFRAGILNDDADDDADGSVAEDKCCRCFFTGLGGLFF